MFCAATWASPRPDGHALTRDEVRRIIDRHLATAIKTCPELTGKNVTPTRPAPHLSDATLTRQLLQRRRQPHRSTNGAPDARAPPITPKQSPSPDHPNSHDGSAPVARLRPSSSFGRTRCQAVVRFALQRVPSPRLASSQSALLSLNNSTALRSNRSRRTCLPRRHLRLQHRH